MIKLKKYIADNADRSNANEYREELISVVITDGITEIGSRVFAGCTGLTAIVVPESVTRIKRDAFSGCINLKNIQAPERLKRKILRQIKNYTDPAAG